MDSVTVMAVEGAAVKGQLGGGVVVEGAVVNSSEQ